MTLDDIKAELEKLSSEMIATILGGLHDLVAGHLAAASKDILRRRHGVTRQWWRETVQYGDQNHRYAFGDLPRHEVVAYCGGGEPPRGAGDAIRHDPAHATRHEADLSPFGRANLIACACGRSDDDLVLRFYRVVPTASVWPVVTIPERNGGHPCYQVCGRAKHADEQAHGPSRDGTRCLCGWPLGMYYDESSGKNVYRDQFMPCY